MRNCYIKLILLLLFLGALKTDAQITVTATAGTLTGSYTTLKNTFDAINNGTHKGAIDIRVNQSTTETASARLDSSGVTTGASYTSIVIRPADTATVNKTIKLNLSGAIAVDLNGADNVTIDGRPLGTGTSKLLTLQHASPNANVNSIVLRVINGVSNLIVQYTNSQSLTTTAGSNTANISLSTSVSTTGNNNVTIDHCNITGGVTGVDILGTAANFMDNIFVTNNTITNAQANSIAVSGVMNLAIQSNNISHNTSISGWNVNGITISLDVSGANYLVNGNTILNIGSLSLAQIIGILVTPSLAAPTVVPQLKLTNNYVGLFANNTAALAIRGLHFQGSANPLVLTVLFNTFRIGGAGTATSGNPGTVAVAKTNTSAATSFTFLNNLCINTRTGTTNQHIGYWNEQPTSGTINSDYNTTWGGPGAVSAWGSFFQTDEAGFKAAAFPSDQNSTAGNVSFINTISPDLLATNKARLLIGVPAGGVTQDIYGVTRNALNPYRGAYESATFKANDASVNLVYTYGKILAGTNDTIRAVVSNEGVQNITGMYVKLRSTLSGFSDSVLINLPKLSETIVYFPPFTPSALGIDTIKASVPADDDVNNNNVDWVRENTLNALSYTDQRLPQRGNIGGAAPGEIIVKFVSQVANTLSEVNIDFTNTAFSGPAPFQVVIYADSGSALGPKRVPLWVSANQNTISGIFNLTIPAIPVGGIFYIGVRQTTNADIGFAYQVENPLRDSTFYFRRGVAFATLGWSDFAIPPSTPYRFMIEPRFTSGPLPVHLLYFAGKETKGDVELTWETTTEINNAGFIIERSTDGRNFTRAGFVQAVNNSGQKPSYKTNDAMAFTVTGSRTLYYRLLQQDRSGKLTTSNIIKVSLNKLLRGEVAVYPNPFRHEIKLYLDMITGANAELTVTDLSGRKVYETRSTLRAGENSWRTTALDKLPKGMYMLQLTLNGEVSIHKLLKD
ncbi:MAG: T9SS type A sorting domain-containing protein [Ferruginibacter sp.]